MTRGVGLSGLSLTGRRRCCECLDLADPSYENCCSLLILLLINKGAPCHFAHVLSITCWLVTDSGLMDTAMLLR